MGTTGEVDGAFVGVHVQYFCSSQAIGHPSPLHSNQGRSAGTRRCLSRGTPSRPRSRRGTGGPRRIGSTRRSAASADPDGCSRTRSLRRVSRGCASELVGPGVCRGRLGRRPERHTSWRRRRRGVESCPPHSGRHRRVSRCPAHEGVTPTASLRRVGVRRVTQLLEPRGRRARHRRVHVRELQVGLPIWSSTRGLSSSRLPALLLPVAHLLRDARDSLLGNVRHDVGRDETGGCVARATHGPHAAATSAHATATRRSPTELGSVMTTTRTV